MWPKAQSWTLEESLTRDWTDNEKSPAENSDFDKWTVPQRLEVHKILIQIIHAIKREYNTRSEAHAVKRGLRYGLTVLNDEWENTISQLFRNRIVAGKVSEYIPRGGMYDFDKTDSLAVDWGRKVDRKSWRIIWNQKGFVKFLSEALGANQADIVRWSIMIVGDALGQRGKIGPALHDNIGDILDEIEYRVKDIAANRRSDRRAGSLMLLQGNMLKKPLNSSRRNIPTFGVRFVGTGIVTRGEISNVSICVLTGGVACVPFPLPDPPIELIKVVRSWQYRISPISDCILGVFAEGEEPRQQVLSMISIIHQLTVAQPLSCGFSDQRNVLRKHTPPLETTFRSDTFQIAV